MNLPLQVPRKSPAFAERASALIITLFVILVIAGLTGVAVNLTTNTVRQTDSSRDFSALRSSAEGALEFAYGVWTHTVNSYYRPVTKAELTAPMAKVPSFTSLSYAPLAENGPLTITPVDTYGQPVASTTATPAPTKIKLDNYPGWSGYNSSYIASVRLSGTTSGGRTINTVLSGCLITKSFRFFRRPLSSKMTWNFIRRLK